MLVLPAFRRHIKKLERFESPKIICMTTSHKKGNQKSSAGTTQWPLWVTDHLGDIAQQSQQVWEKSKQTLKMGAFTYRKSSSDCKKGPLERICKQHLRIMHFTQKKKRIHAQSEETTPIIEEKKRLQQLSHEEGAQETSAIQPQFFGKMCFLWWLKDYALTTRDFVLVGD